MKRVDFIKKIGSGIAVYSIFPIGSKIYLSNKEGTKKWESKNEDVFRPDGYHLIWEDRFDGSALDESEWFYRMDLKAASVQRPENVSIRDGNLVLAMKKEDFLGMRFSGCGIVSKRRWQHGYYEVRAKLTKAPGWHHAFWAQAGTGFLTFSYDRFMEIDAMEMEETSASNFNLWTPEDNWKSKDGSWESSGHQSLGFDASDGYHVYGYEYAYEGIRFFVDGRLVHKIDATEDDYKHYAMNLWLTVIATHSDQVSDLPAYDYYDYVRCYSKNPNAKLPPKITPTNETGNTIYIDNYDPWGFNMGTYWKIEDEGGHYYGKNYYKWKPQKVFNPDSDWALFRPFISKDGNYDIYLRWPAKEENAFYVPLEIWYDGGRKTDKTRSINQQRHDKEWVKIGRYPLKEGWDNYVKLIAKDSGYTVADAAKFVLSN